MLLAAIVFASGCRPSAEPITNDKLKDRRDFSAFARVRGAQSLTVLAQLDPRTQVAFLNRALEEQGDQKDDDRLTQLQSIASGLFASSLGGGTTSFLEIPITLSVQLRQFERPIAYARIAVTIPGCAKGVQIRSWSQPRWLPAEMRAGEASTVRAIAVESIIFPEPPAPANASGINGGNVDAGDQSGQGEGERAVEIIGFASEQGDLAGTVEIDLDLEIPAAEAESATAARPGCSDDDLACNVQTWSVRDPNRDLNQRREVGRWILPSIHPVTLNVRLTDVDWEENTLEKLRRETFNPNWDRCIRQADVRFVPAVWASTQACKENPFNLTPDNSHQWRCVHASGARCHEPACKHATGASPTP